MGQLTDLCVATRDVSKRVMAADTLDLLLMKYNAEYYKFDFLESGM